MRQRPKRRSPKSRSSSTRTSADRTPSHHRQLDQIATATAAVVGFVGDDSDPPILLGRGTDGSNPSPSTGESTANLAFGAQMLACMSVIWGGVCERHPKIRIAFLESGGGWIAPWLDRMDRHFDNQGFNDSGLKTWPSELFQRNCWISFEPVEGSLKVLADYIGPNKILWATDYPHSDGFFPGAPKMILDRLEGVSPETRHGVMAGGAMGFYGLN